MVNHLFGKDFQTILVISIFTYKNKEMSFLKKNSWPFAEITLSLVAHKIAKIKLL